MGALRWRYRCIFIDMKSLTTCGYSSSYYFKYDVFIYHIYKETIWKDIQKILRTVSPSSGIMYASFYFLFFVFVLVFLSSNFSTVNTISHTIKNVKNSFIVMQNALITTCSYKLSFRTYNKNKTKVPLPSSELRKHSILLLQTLSNTKGIL